MPERKIWTPEEDRILKLLIEERGETKWAQISLIMEQQFNITGRNGKQCRERYHNHLDKNINSAELTRQEENILFDLQDQLGNKWALISGKLAGRTDNSLKNHFYSKLRKSIRKINKRIHKYMKRQFRDIKINTLYKIIETMEKGNKITESVDASMYELSRKIKRQLRKYQDNAEQFQNIQQELAYVRIIVQDIAVFDKEIKKSQKKLNHKLSLQFSGELRIESSSICDDESQSYGSELLSSSTVSINYINTVASQNIGQPHKVRSESNQSLSDGEQNDDQRNFKYRSANSICWKRSQVVGSEQKVKHQVLTHRRSQSSNQSEKSCSSKGRQQQQQCFNLNSTQIWGEGSMRVMSPKRLTIQERIQMEDERDQLFGDMDIEQNQLIQNFSDFRLNSPVCRPPKLGQLDFD